MTIEEAKIWITQQEFVYAKSYAKTFPHHYTTKDRCDRQKFEEFITLIREYGKCKSFFKKQMLYLELDEYEYWEMGRPIKAVVVLNRAIINDNERYRIPVPSIEDEKELKAKLLQREIYLDCLLDKQNKTEKDNEIIRFMLDNKRRIDGGGKNILDHSKQIINYEN